MNENCMSGKSRQLQNKRTLDCPNVIVKHQQVSVMYHGNWEQTKKFFVKSKILCKIPGKKQL